MKSKRAQKARKYFPGGKMPDGLELFPLTQGKLEILMELAEELEPKELESITVFLYAHSLEEAERGMNDDNILAKSEDFVRQQTREDIEAAQLHIEADFAAMAASAVQPESGGEGKQNSAASRSPGRQTKSQQSETSGSDTTKLETASP